MTKLNKRFSSNFQLVFFKWSILTDQFSVKEENVLASGNSVIKFVLSSEKQTYFCVNWNRVCLNVRHTD